MSRFAEAVRVPIASAASARHDVAPPRRAVTIGRAPRALQRCPGNAGCGCDHQPQGRNGTGSAAIPAVVRTVLRDGSARSLDSGVRKTFEARFSADFSQVRVHVGSQAAESAKAVSARAYTVGRDIVFGAGQYAPGTTSGQRLLGHELTHVVQQSGAVSAAGGLELGATGTAAEIEADRLSMLSELDGGAVSEASATATVQRQFVTPLGPGGGFGGLLERDRRRIFGPGASSGGPTISAGAPARVCARELQAPGLNLIAGHAYIEAPPFRYAIISPLCPPRGFPWDNPVTGTTAQKWDNSPDPCGKTPTCLDCNPLPGITDVRACLKSAFTAYHPLSLYRGLGPNSNTFAGTLARHCCAGMIPKPAAFPWLPGWTDAPAPARAGATPCPPGPTC